MKQPYSHQEEIHNISDPQQIVPVIINLINPGSVIDIGCGLGTFMRVFKEAGVQDIVGIDGSWCDKDLLFKNINPNEFIESDVRQSFDLKRRFDLVVCLEVAEHLPSERADSFVSDLIAHGDVILFSAAIPGQWGTNHLNEQWITYWEDKFIRHNYLVHDILKSYFWNQGNIFWWYSQNMVIIAKRGYQFKTGTQLNYNYLNHIVHPELFKSRNNYLMDIVKGKSPLKYYVKLLIKAIVYRFGKRK